MSDPPDHVAIAFGATGPAEDLSEGDETSVRVGDLVLKQVLDPSLAAWNQEALHRIEAAGFRVATPVAADGSWVLDGWIASRYISDLRSGRGRWSEIAAAGRRFSAALTTTALDPTPVLARTDRWAVAERFAWGEVDVELRPDAATIVDRIRAHERPSDEPPALVHADLTGNVFFDADDIPVILDLSPALRPPAFASGVVAADAMAWNGAGVEVADALDPDRVALPQAMIFRIAAEQLAVDPRHGARLADHERVLDLLGW